MPYETINYRLDGRVAYITLNRPHVLNAANGVLLTELGDALETFDRDPDAWVAILSGAGRAFCVGFDVKEMFVGKEPGTPWFEGKPVSLADSEHWKPVIAAVHGYVYGYGLILASECDLIVAAEDTRFAMSEVRRGSSAGTGLHRLLYWMPSKVASEMVLTGDAIDASTAYRLGLVNQVTSQDQLLPAAHALAERIVTAAPLPVREGVRVLRTAAERSLAQVADWVDYRRFDDTEDFAEASRAFAEKRAPHWQAR